MQNTKFCIFNDYSPNLNWSMGIKEVLEYKNVLGTIHCLQPLCSFQFLVEYFVSLIDTVALMIFYLKNNNIYFMYGRLALIYQLRTGRSEQKLIWCWIENICTLLCFMDILFLISYRCHLSKLINSTLAPYKFQS